MAPERARGTVCKQENQLLRLIALQRLQHRAFCPHDLTKSNKHGRQPWPLYLLRLGHASVRRALLQTGRTLRHRTRGHSRESPPLAELVEEQWDHHSDDQAHPALSRPGAVCQQSLRLQFCLMAATALHAACSHQHCLWSRGTAVHNIPRRAALQTGESKTQASLLSHCTSIACT